MMSRTYMIPAIILWCASTTWLISTKILPTLTRGRPPVDNEMLSQLSPAQPVKWLIRWNDQEIGWAQNRFSRGEHASSLTSEVQFEELPVDQMLKQLLGAVGAFVPMPTDHIGPLQLRVLTVMDFDDAHTLQRFVSTADIGELAGLLKIEGQRRDERLNLVAQVHNADGSWDMLSRKEILIPRGALVADTFSPRPMLSKLHVGQKWTFQSYRPLMPYSPLELVEASVEQEELLEWSGAMVRTYRVVYRRDAGSGLSATRHPTSVLWVTSAGTVLRQDLYLASVRVQFVRASSSPHPRLSHDSN